MADFTLDFDTPKTASGRTVEIKGTVPAGTLTWDAAGQITVTRANNSVQYFSFVNQYVSTTIDYLVDQTIVLAIVPKLSGTDTATTFISSGALEATIV